MKSDDGDECHQVGDHDDSSNSDTDSSLSDSYGYIGNSPKDNEARLLLE